MKGIVYRANNKITDESYIGITTNSIRQRQLDHVERALRGEPGKFYEAIATYGSDVFNWEQIDTAYSTNELAEKEKQYILSYNTMEEGYNTDSGGGISKTVYQYNMKTLELVDEYSNLRSAAERINATKQDISRACLSANGELGGFYWNYKKMEIFKPKGDSRKKQVLQLDMNYDLVGEYNSVAEASQSTGISKTCISRVCRNERQSSGGYIWRYCEEDEY